MYLSGRPDRLGDDTLSWLRRAGAPDGQVALRPDGGRRPARVVEDLYRAQELEGRT